MTDPKLVRADLIRRRGNHTVTWETEWSDGCVTQQRTATTYDAARVTRRNPRAVSCVAHRRVGS